MSDSEASLSQLDATKIRTLIDSGASSCLELIKLYCHQAALLDEPISAMAFFNPKSILHQASQIDENRSRGMINASKLHGVPIAISDNIDSMDMFSTIGSPLLAGRHPKWDAMVIKRLRDNGAITFCKAKVPDFCLGAQPSTSNPFDLNRKVGLASGAAAALVAGGIVPIAIGTQSLGSITESASVCGVVGYKPTRSLISRSGIFCASRTLEQVGIFSKTVEDAALVAEILIGSDDEDQITKGILPRPLLDICLQDAPLTPSFVFLKTTDWHDMDPEAREAIEALIDGLSECITCIDMPESTKQAKEWQDLIVMAEFNQAMAMQKRQLSKKLPKEIQDAMKSGSKITAQNYLRSIDAVEMVADCFNEFFDRFDCIITPSNLGFAMPQSNQGEPHQSLSNSLWSITGMPSISVPILQSSNNLPLGVQLTGKRMDDARLLRTARWLMNRFN